MTDEEELRRMLHGADSPTNTLDARRIVAKSRARRLPKQIAAAAGGALVLAGVTVLAIQTTNFPSTTSMSGGQAFESSEAAPEADSSQTDSSQMDTMLKRAPADKINLCTAPLSEVAGSQYGLQLEIVSPTTAPVGGESVPVTVRLTNTSNVRVVGYTPSSPAITFSQDGIVLWHSNGPTVLSIVAVDLAPGESLEYAASFEPVRCDIADDEAESFRTGLPAVGPGGYGLSALIDFTPDASMGAATAELDLVSGPVSPVAIG